MSHCTHSPLTISHSFDYDITPLILHSFITFSFSPKPWEKKHYLTCLSSPLTWGDPLFQEKKKQILLPTLRLRRFYFLTMLYPTAFRYGQLLCLESEKWKKGQECYTYFVFILWILVGLIALGVWQSPHSFLWNCVALADEGHDPQRAGPSQTIADTKTTLTSNFAFLAFTLLLVSFPTLYYQGNQIHCM